MNKYSKTFMEMALVASKLSKDPRTQVGAIIVSPDNRKFSMGYNGFPTGYPDTVDLWNNREEKHKRVIHAEINAVLNCTFPTQGCSIYVTLHPCHRCLGMLIQAGIKNIYYLEKYDKECETELVEELSQYFNIQKIEL